MDRPMIIRWISDVPSKMVKIRANGWAIGAADLAATLAASPEESYIRVVADWLAHAEVAPAAPALTGRPVVDALVAAGTAHLARMNEAEPPAWTQEPARVLPSLWHPGSDRFFAYSLAHTPVPQQPGGGTTVQASPLPLAPRGVRDQVRRLLIEQRRQIIGEQPQLTGLSRLSRGSGGAELARGGLRTPDPGRDCRPGSAVTFPLRRSVSRRGRS